MNSCTSSSEGGGNPARYLVWSGAAFLVIVVFAASVNAVVDPYRVFGLVEITGFNARKPRAAERGRLSKEVGLSMTKPVNLILGNSRAEVGFDPESPFWPREGITYNAGLPGSGPAAALDLLRRGLATGMARNVLIGVDFPDFLVDSNQTAAPRNTADAADTSELVATWKSWIKPFRTRIDLLFSADALIDSALTVIQQGRPDAPDLTRLGFNPLREYVIMAKRDGYGALFLQRDEENTRNYLRMPKDLFVGGTKTSANWHDLQEIVDLCRSKDLRCNFVIYPYHAHILELFELTGLWNGFEDWKRELVRIIDHRANVDSKAEVSLWDFSGYHRYACESVPALGDRVTEVNGYWEAGHFKRGLGDKMLERLFGRGDDQFGVKLTSTNIEQQLVGIRHDRALFRNADPATYAAMQAMVRRQKSPSR